MSRDAKLAMALIGDRVGAVILFREGTTEEEARRALINVPCVDAEEIDVHSFNPRLGYPVWYIP